MKNIFLTFREALSALFRERKVVKKSQTVYNKLSPKSNKVITIDARNVSKQPPNKSASHKSESDISDTEYLKITSQLMNSSNKTEFVILPFEDVRLLNLLTKQYQPDMFKYVLKRLNIAINSNLPEVTIFQFGKTDGIARISSENYEKQLKTLLNYFIKVEDYESASTCRDLIKQLNHNIKVEQ